MLEQNVRTKSLANRIMDVVLSHYSIIIVLSLLLFVQIYQNQMLIRRISGTPVVESNVLVGSKIEFPQLKTVDGKEYHFNRSSKYMIVYFHTDCQYCHHDLPLWREMQKRSSEYGIQMVAVTQETNQPKVTRFVRDSQIAFPVLLDPEHKLIDRLQAEGTPMKVLIGLDGQVMQVWRGLTTRESGEAALSGLMIAFGISPELLPINADLP